MQQSDILITIAKLFPIVIATVSLLKKRVAWISGFAGTVTSFLVSGLAVYGYLFFDKFSAPLQGVVLTCLVGLCSAGGFDFIKEVIGMIVKPNGDPKDLISSYLSQVGKMFNSIPAPEAPTTVTPAPTSDETQPPTGADNA